MTMLTGIHSGRLVDPMNLSDDEIDIDTIAHSLAMQCRYGGHVKTHYSVAQHCVLLSKVVHPLLAFAALMHDACEAFVSDLPRPIKSRLPDYYVIEEAVIASICRKFAIDPEDMKAVVPYDMAICLDEMAQLCKFTDPKLATVTKKLNVHIDPMSIGDAKDAFLERFLQLQKNGRGLGARLGAAAGIAG
jgi:5'-deoxynucleotidase YfbR-like HD superfamily hydrolase